MHITSKSSFVTAPTEIQDVDPAQNKGKKEVVFIEDNINDYQTLIAGVNAGMEVVLLDSTQDGLAQMALWALSHSNYDAIHLISHGREGSLDLGGLNLDTNTIESRSSDLAQLGDSLTEDGDLLLYGCDVASDEGQNFIHALAQATQADVAASDDLTGAAVLGGDWELEISTGSINEQSLLVDDFDSSLAIDDTKLHTYSQNTWAHSELAADANGNTYLIHKLSNTDISVKYFDGNSG